MRHNLVALLALVLLPSDNSFGQVYFAPFDVIFTDSLTLLRLEEVQEDLKLTADQNAKIKNALAPVRAKYEKGITAIQSVPREQQSKRVETLRREIKDEGFQAVRKIVQPKQFDRFKQICLQERGFNAFSEKDVQNALKLTDKQLKAVPMVLAEREKKLKALRVIRYKDMQRMDAETMEAFLALLTPPQKQAWDKLVGPQLKIERFGMLQRLK